MDRKIEISKEQKEEDKLLIAKVLDKIKLVENKNRFECTEFLDLRQQSLVKVVLDLRKYYRYKLIGGYEDSERKIIIVFSENFDLEYIDNKIYNQFLSVINITLPAIQKGEYEHRNYLGGLMKLGIKREKIGDIIVRDDGADIIVRKDIAEYIMTNLSGLTRFQKAKIELKNIEDIIESTVEKVKVKINIPSMRLDCIVGELARCSRSTAIKYLNEERVFVNFKQEVRPSKSIKEGDNITIRGKGRFKVNKILGNTRSGRISLEIEK